jgi:tetratricopeptide (TPR) repeat protein
LARGDRLVDLLELGDRAGADQELARYRQLAEELRAPRQRWVVTMLEVMESILVGRFSATEELATEALTLGQQAQELDAFPLFAVQLFVLRREQDRLAELKPLLEDLLERGPVTPGWRLALAAVHADVGDLERAARALGDLAADGFRELSGDSMALVLITLAAEVAHAVGDADAAAKAYPLLEPYADLVVVLGVGAVAVGSAARYLGLVTSTLGQWDRAEHHFLSAVTRNDSLGARPWAATARADWAEMLLRRAGPGDRERAMELLNQAEATAADLDMARLSRRTAALRASAN